VKSDGRNGSIFRLLFPGKVRHTIVRIHVQGTHNISNALAAAAVGAVLGLPGAVIAQGLFRFRPAAMRSQVFVSHGVTVINDCYNANPASMKAAVQLLAQRGEGRRKIAVLGDMLELGADAVSLHREVGAFVAQHGIDQLIACGVLGRNLAEGAEGAGLDRDKIVLAADAAAAAVAVKAVVKQGDVVLAKASRGMKLEQVVHALHGTKRIARKAS
jgi:UDP-N-acetylmuramoyl-tripeptide--D-alanyl-D-alanine ligase